MLAAEIQTLTLEAPVSTVTLLEDRAQVQRLGKELLTAGLWRVQVAQGAPVLSDKSLRAGIIGTISRGRGNELRGLLTPLTRRRKEGCRVSVES